MANLMARRSPADCFGIHQRPVCLIARVPMPQFFATVPLSMVRRCRPGDEIFKDYESFPRAPRKLCVLRSVRRTERKSHCAERISRVDPAEKDEQRARRKLGCLKDQTSFIFTWTTWHMTH